MENEVREKVKRFAERISTLEEETIKYLLWQICYDPIGFLEEYSVNRAFNLKLLQKEILKACQTREKEFIFASREQKLDSFGYKLNICNPIIRDTIIEHCVDISDEPEILRSCILNICTRRDDVEYHERRRVAFDILEFDEKEQKFLERNIDTYCIGELLKAIQARKYPKEVPQKQNSIFKTYAKFGSKTKGSNGECFDKLDSAVLIENKDLVQQFLVYFNGVEVLNPKLLLENMDKVSILIEKAKQIKDKGLDPNQLGQKADAVGKLYESLEAL